MLILTRSDIADVLSAAEVIEVVEQALRSVAEGTASEGARSSLGLPGSETVLIPMVAAAAGAAGLKLLTDAPDNPARSLPRQQSVVMLLDPSTDAVEAILDGAELTRLRTAATSAVATRHLARTDASTLGLIGAGALAAAHLDAVRAVRAVRRVVVWTRSDATMRSFAERCRERSIEVTPVESAQQVAAQADVICTLTPSPTPVLRGAWLRPGTHVNAVGAPPRLNYREIDDEVLTRSRIIVDKREVALAESGAIRHALDHGALDPAAVGDELGDVLAGRVAGRTRHDEITVFNSVGLGIEDLVTARLLVTVARRKNLGRELDLTA